MLAGCGPSEASWLDESVPEPTVFAPGVISGELRDYDITFTPDGREAYFTRRRRRGGGQIYTSTFVDGSWTEPEPAPFSTDRDEAPSITSDGSRMVFASRRPPPGAWDRSDNLWVTERTEDGWSEPTLLPGIVNQPAGEIDDFNTGYELGPTLLANNMLLYWTRVDPDWGSDIYVAEADAEGAFVDPRPLRINSIGDETNPTMSPDGRFLIFQAYRDPNAVGEQDLYVSEQTEYGWSDPILLPEPINSPRNEGYPAFSPNGRHFFFASDRNRRSGYYDVYYVDVDALGLSR